MSDAATVGVPAPHDPAPSGWLAPWWLVLGAAACLLYFVLLVRADVRRPEQPGFSFRVVNGVMRVEDVVPGSPAGVAGLASADKVLVANGRAVRSRRDWSAVEATLQPPWTLALETDRGGTPLRPTLQLPPASLEFWRTTPGVTLAVARAAQFATLILAILVAARRPFDRAARMGAWLLAAVAVYTVDLPFGFAGDWRDLPDPVEVLLWIPYASQLAVAPLLLTFFTLFPRPLVDRGPLWVAIWLPALAMIAVELAGARALLAEPGQVTAALPAAGIAPVGTALYASAALVLIAWRWAREPDTTDRRRVRVVAAGALVGVLAAGPVVAAYWQPGAVVSSTVFGSTAAALGILMGLALPAAFAYAILAQRLFGPSFIVRRSLQYALARRGVIALVPLLGVLFLLDLWSHRQRPLAETLPTHGWIYAALAGAAVAAHRQRDAWLHRLDRRFFREHYDAQRVLRSIADDVRTSPSIAAAAPKMIARLEAALHPALAALLLREPDDDRYRPLATAPKGASITPLRADSAVPRLLALLRHPLHLDEHSYRSLLRRLPSEDLDWLRRHRIELLVPVRSGPGGPESFFAFGPKQSQEPYSSEEEDMLVTIGHGTALLLPRTGAERLEECPACGLCCAPGTRTCPDDGTRLVSEAFPHLLAERYRLERRIGRGGMGTVYAARDCALERPVAVKVLAAGLGDPAAPERFQAEARIVASLAHPHIVTVHDAGVTGGGRAFFVMERLEGETLDEALRREQQFAPDRVLRLLRGIGAAVQAAHARQVVHRDLKPANIFLCRDSPGEHPKVLDFGLAKVLEASGFSSQTRPGLVAGTPRYMAPEHLRGGDASPDWDLWALAAITLEMLAGPRALDRAVGGSPHLDDLPAPLRQVFARALAPDPLDRPTGVDELVRVLEKGLQAYEPR